MTDLRKCEHEGEAGFLASSSYGFIQVETDPRCIHCAWNDLHAAMPERWRLDRLSFLLMGWAVEIVAPDGEIIAARGATPAAAMDAAREELKERKSNG